MKHIPAVVALTITLFSTSSADAACISEAQFDAENCGRMDTCADEIDVTGAIDMTRAAPDNISSMPVENDLLAESPVAVAVADGSCREVQICGTTQLVCD